MASAMIGSALRFADAAAIGAAPTRMTPIAPRAAAVRTLTAPMAPRTAAGRSRSRHGTAAGAATGSAAAGAGVSARYPAVNSRIIGIMLLGSVPSPPRKPRSSISTQSARHSTVAAITAGRTSRGRPARSRAEHGQRDHREQVHREPVRGGERRETRDQGGQQCGCDAWAIDCTMPVRVPGWPPAVPCQKPRPGQACSTAMPMKKAPVRPGSADRS